MQLAVQWGPVESRFVLVQSSPVESSFVLSTAVESSQSSGVHFVLKVADSPVESSFVLSTAVESSGVQVCVESSSGVQSSPLLCRMQLAVQWSPGLC